MRPTTDLERSVAFYGSTLGFTQVMGFPGAAFLQQPTAARPLPEPYEAEIARQAKAHGYATFSLGELYDKSKVDLPFDLIHFMTSGQPYGPTISLDGVHPSAAGHAILANAAFKAIQKTYGKTTP